MNKRAICERYYQQILMEILNRIPSYHVLYQQYLQGESEAAADIEKLDRMLLVPREMKFWLKEFCELDQKNGSLKNGQSFIYVNMLLYLAKQRHHIVVPKAQHSIPREIATILVQRFYQTYRQKDRIMLPEPLYGMECLLWSLADVSARMYNYGLLSVYETMTEWAKRKDLVWQFAADGIKIYIDGTHEKIEFVLQVSNLYEQLYGPIAESDEVEQGKVALRFLKAMPGFNVKEILAVEAERYLPELACKEFVCFLESVV